MAYVLVGPQPMACMPIICTKSKNTQVPKEEYISQPSDTPRLTDQDYSAE